MILVGIDPSYTRTGIAFIRSKSDYKLFSVSMSGDVDRIHIAISNAHQIASEIRKLILFYKNEYPEEEFIFGVEYPILATRSGSYLGLLTAKLDSMFRSIKNVKVYFIPSIACKSLTKTNTKSDLVKWVKESNLVEKFKGNHDEATGVVLAEIARLSHEKQYKNTTFLVNY